MHGTTVSGVGAQATPPQGKVEHYTVPRRWSTAGPVERLSWLDHLAGTQKSPISGAGGPLAGRWPKSAATAVGIEPGSFRTAAAAAAD